MPTVWVRGEDRARRTFHRTKACHQFAKKAAAPPQEVELSSLRYKTPCLSCYPDAPRARSAHFKCEKCHGGQVGPCRHNGGVPVTIEVTRRKTNKIFTSPGDTYLRVIYVWPERARHYVA